MRPDLSAATGARIAALLATHGAPALAPFAEAFVAQAAHPLGRTGDAAARATHDARERDAADALTVLLGGATTGGVARAAAVALLRDEPALLAVCFQNLDLLPVGAPADGIATIVGAAIAGLPPAPPPAAPLSDGA